MDGGIDFEVSEEVLKGREIAGALGEVLKGNCESVCGARLPAMAAPERPGHKQCPSPEICFILRTRVC